MLSGAILGALIGIWQGGLFHFTLWWQICPFGRAGFSEREIAEADWQLSSVDDDQPGKKIETRQDFVQPEVFSISLESRSH